jgi:hypothetical protein
MSLDDQTKKATTVLTGAAALAASIKVERSDEHDEVERVDVLGVPLFKRDERGNPRILGIPFRRWIRGPRK